MISFTLFPELLPELRLAIVTMHVDDVKHEDGNAVHVVLSDCNLVCKEWNAFVRPRWKKHAWSILQKTSVPKSISRYRMTTIEARSFIAEFQSYKMSASCTLAFLRQQFIFNTLGRLYATFNGILTSEYDEPITNVFSDPKFRNWLLKFACSPEDVVPQRRWSRDRLNQTKEICYELMFCAEQYERRREDLSEAAKFSTLCLFILTQVLRMIEWKHYKILVKIAS